MRNVIFAALIVIIALLVNSCSDTPFIQNQHQELETDANCETGTTYPLIAGQHDTVGTLHVYNDNNNIYVTYTITDPDLCTDGLHNLHLWVGNDLTNVDNGGDCRPSPGQLCQQYGGFCADANGAFTYTFTIPLNSIGIVDIQLKCNTNLYVVAHAEACGETAFGGNVPGQTNCGNAWWFYAQYTLCCTNVPPPPGNGTCQTAFAKGGWVWTTGPNSNPENLPSLSLMKNRWGWAINLVTPGTYTYEIWSGAGLNNTSHGSLVGECTVVWNGTTATVTYDLNQGCVLREVHLYAADSRPITVAPGQYGNTAGFDPPVSSYTFTVPLENTNGVDGVWLIAHAVACCE